MGSNLMRTVTFADDRVIRKLQNEFVLIWHNQNPGMFVQGEQAPSTPEQMRNYPEGGGGANVVTAAFDEDGRKLMQLMGFWRPDRYLTELNFFGDLHRIARKHPTDRATQVRKALDERTKSLIAARAALAKAHPQEFAKPVRDSEIRKRDAADGLLQTALEQSVATIDQQFIVTLNSLSHRLKVFA